MNAATNIGINFFLLFNEYFPENNKLHKTFNRTTTKLSHSCMTYVKQKIDNDNQQKIKFMVNIKRNLLELAKRKMSTRGSCVQSQSIESKRLIHRDDGKPFHNEIQPP